MAAANAGSPIDCETTILGLSVETPPAERNALGRLRATALPRPCVRESGTEREGAPLRAFPRSMAGAERPWGIDVIFEVMSLAIGQNPRHSR